MCSVGVLFRHGQNGSHLPEQGRALGLGGGREPFEILCQPNIGKERIAVLVEMQEGSTAAVEDAARFFGKAGNFPQLPQQRFKTLKRCGRCVFHGADAGFRNGKDTTRAGTVRVSRLSDPSGKVSENSVPGRERGFSTCARAIARRNSGERTDVSV